MRYYYDYCGDFGPNNYSGGDYRHSETKEERQKRLSKEENKLSIRASQLQRQGKKFKRYL